MSFPDLIIGGIVVPRRGIKITQEYEPLGAASLLRMGNGEGIIQSNEWQKLRTSISCSGWAVSGLDGLNWLDEAGIVIACYTPLSISTDSSDDHVVTIPGTIREDHEPLGYALFGSREVPTGISMAGNIATLEEVEGATAYKVRWLPVLTCFCPGGVKPGYSTSGNEFAWSLIGEEL